MSNVDQVQYILHRSTKLRLNMSWNVHYTDLKYNLIDIYSIVLWSEAPLYPTDGLAKKFVPLSTPTALHPSRTVSSYVGRRLDSSYEGNWAAGAGVGSCVLLSTSGSCDVVTGGCPFWGRLSCLDLEHNARWIKYPSAKRSSKISTPEIFRVTMAML